MRTAALLLCLAVASGCSHTHTAINAGTATATSATAGSVSVQAHSHSLAALVVAGMFMAAAIDYSRDPRPFPSFSSFADWFRGAPQPLELDAGLRVIEHDCTKPLPVTSGNLRCR